MTQDSKGNREMPAMPSRGMAEAEADAAPADALSPTLVRFGAARRNRRDDVNFFLLGKDFLKPEPQLPRPRGKLSNQSCRYGKIACAHEGLSDLISPLPCRPLSSLLARCRSQTPSPSSTSAEIISSPPS